MPVDHWPLHARQWARLGPPLRPTAEDMAVVAGQLRGSRGLLLGVTPEVAALPWAGALLAVDRSQPMIREVWPGPAGASVVCADWRWLPLASGRFDLVVGDGCASVFAWPGEYRALGAEMRRVLVAGGRLVLRLFTSPEAREDVRDLAGDLRAGRVRNFHAFKWRLAMALQPSTEAGVRLGDIWDAWRSIRPAEEIDGADTIDAYRGSDVRYSFPTLAQHRAALGQGFSELACVTGSYELAERCPTLILERR